MSQSILGGMAAARATALTPPPSQVDVVDLSGEFPGGSTSPTLRESTVDAIERHWCDHYTRRPGIAPLCRAVAASLAAEGVPSDENLVTICGSAAEARYVALRALAENKAVYLPEPAPTIYAAALQFAGASVVQVDVHAALPSVTGGVLVLSNPHPLTGQVYAADLLEKLAGWVVASGLTVVVDETVGLVHAEALFIRFAALPEMAAHTLTLGSFADTPGLAAWQVSWIAGPKSIFTPVRDLKQSITICTAAASQYAALTAATEPGEGGAKAQFAERQEAILALLDRHGMDYLPPDTLSFVVVRVQDSDAAAAACARHGILVGNGAALGDPGMIRIGVPSGSLGVTLEGLDAAFHELKGR